MEILDPTNLFGEKLPRITLKSFKLSYIYPNIAD